MGHVGNSNWQTPNMFFETSPTKKSEIRVVRIQEGDYIEWSPKRITTASFREGFGLGGRDSGSGCSNGRTSSHSHCSESQQDFEAKELQGSSGYLVFENLATAMKHDAIVGSPQSSWIASSKSMGSPRAVKQFLMLQPTLTRQSMMRIHRFHVLRMHIHDSEGHLGSYCGCPKSDMT